MCIFFFEAGEFGGRGKQEGKQNVCSFCPHTAFPTGSERGAQAQSAQLARTLPFFWYCIPPPPHTLLRRTLLLRRTHMAGEVVTWTVLAILLPGYAFVIPIPPHRLSSLWVAGVRFLALASILLWLAALSIVFTHNPTPPSDPVPSSTKPSNEPLIAVSLAGSVTDEVKAVAFPAAGLIAALLTLLFKDVLSSDESHQSQTATQTATQSSPSNAPPTSSSEQPSVALIVDVAASLVFHTITPSDPLNPPSPYPADVLEFDGDLEADNGLERVMAFVDDVTPRTLTDEGRYEGRVVLDAAAQAIRYAWLPIALLWFVPVVCGTPVDTPLFLLTTTASTIIFTMLAYLMFTIIIVYRDAYAARMMRFDSWAMAFLEETKGAIQDAGMQAVRDRVAFYWRARRRVVADQASYVSGLQESTSMFGVVLVVLAIVGIGDAIDYFAIRTLCDACLLAVFVFHIAVVGQHVASRLVRHASLVRTIRMEGLRIGLDDPYLAAMVSRIEDDDGALPHLLGQTLSPRALRFAGMAALGWVSVSLSKFL